MMFYHTFSAQGAHAVLVASITLMCLFSTSAHAQPQPPPPPASQPEPPPASQPGPPLAPQTTPQPFTQEELKQLVGPIALYPDALIALILPAATAPSDLVLAARFVASKSDSTQVANQPWDDSVKSLARYPDIVKWMDQNLEWTTQLGEAFLDQPADVMNTIQQLRAQARAAGTLVDTPQQKVVEDESYIRVVPAEPDVIYVPQYDPEVVFVESDGPYGSYDSGYYPYEAYSSGPSWGPAWGPALTFGIGFAVGPWLNYDCDWPRRKVCVGDWNPRWRNDWDSGWRRGPRHREGGDYEVRNTVNVVNISSDTARVWEPSRKIQRQHWQRQRNDDANVSGQNFRERTSEGRDSWRRFSSVSRPSRLNLENQEGNVDRQRRSDRDRSDFVRDRSGRSGSRVQDVTPGPQFREGEERSLDGQGRGRANRDRGQDFVRDSNGSGRSRSRVQDASPGPRFDGEGSPDSAREGRGRANRDRGQDLARDSSESGRSRSRVQNAEPGPQFREEGQRNSGREGSGRANRDRGQDLGDDSSDSGRSRSRAQDATPGPQFGQGEQNAGRENRRQDVRASQPTPRARSQASSGQSRRPSEVQERRLRSDSDSVRSNRPPSPNRNSYRSQQSQRSVSRGEGDSNRQVNSNRGSSSEVRKSQSQRSSEVKSQRSDSSRQAKSNPSRSQSKASQGNSPNYSRSRESQQSARVERSGGGSRRSEPSYSRQQGQQQSASAAGKSRGGGKQSGGKKGGNKDKDKD
jgi:Protein of unknown function (DUF3300)